MPNPQAGGPPLVGSPRLLIQYIRSYPPSWRTFPHPQPEDAPCRGDRDPLVMAVIASIFQKCLLTSVHLYCMHLHTFFSYKRSVLFTKPSKRSMAQSKIKNLLSSCKQGKLSASSRAGNRLQYKMLLIKVPFLNSSTTWEVMANSVSKSR